MRTDVAIIGGGVIGLTCAYFLSKEGYDVSVFDNNSSDLYHSCSWGSSGMIVPSHIVPLAAPGVIKQGLKWLLDPKSPFSIEFKPNWNMISWLLKFRSAANKKHVVKAANFLRQISLESRDIYKKLSDNMDFGFENNGILMICKKTELLAEEIEIAKMANELGMKSQTLNQSELAKVETGMKISSSGGVFYPLDAHLDPGKYLYALNKTLKEMQVKVFYETKVDTFARQNELLTSISTSKGNCSAKYFVLAAGSFSSNFAKQVGLKLPMMSGKGYSVTMKNPPKKPHIPSILVDSRIASTPFNDSWRVGGTMTVTENSAKINENKLTAIRENVQNFYPEYHFEWTEALKPWVGLRPLSADGLPYIGSFAKCKNLVAATGHAMLGVSLAPITGKLVTDIIAKKPFDYEMQMLSPDRFN